MTNDICCASNKHHTQASRFTYLADPRFPQDSNFLLSLVAAAEIGSWGSLQAPVQNGQNLQKEGDERHILRKKSKSFQPRKLMKSSRMVGSRCLLWRFIRRWLPRGQKVHRLCYLPPADFVKQRGKSSCVPRLLRSWLTVFTGPKNRQTKLKLEATSEIML